MSALFIGGTRDGQRIEVDESLPIIRMPIPLFINYMKDLDTTEYTTINIEEYLRSRLRDELGRDFQIYHFKDDRMTTVERLIHGYRLSAL